MIKNVQFPHPPLGMWRDRENKCDLVLLLCEMTCVEREWSLYTETNSSSSSGCVRGWWNWWQSGAAWVEMRWFCQGSSDVAAKGAETWDLTCFWISQRMSTFFLITDEMCEDVTAAVGSRQVRREHFIWLVTHSFIKTWGCIHLLPLRARPQLCVCTSVLL